MQDKHSPLPEEIRRLFDSPDLYVRDMNWQTGEASCLRMSRETYSASSFLDQRTVALDGQNLALPVADLMRAYRQQQPAPRPLRIYRAYCPVRIDAAVPVPRSARPLPAL